MDFRRIARRRLPSPVFHYLDGGADDEWTLRRNTEAFSDYELLPTQLSDVLLAELDQGIGLVRSCVSQQEGHLYPQSAPDVLLESRITRWSGPKTLMSRKKSLISSLKV